MVAEMIEALRDEWRGDLTMAELIALAQRLDHMLEAIRTERQIKPPTPAPKTIADAHAQDAHRACCRG